LKSIVMPVSSEYLLVEKLIYVLPWKRFVSERYTLYKNRLESHWKFMKEKVCIVLWHLHMTNLGSGIFLFISLFNWKELPVVDRQASSWCSGISSFLYEVSISQTSYFANKQPSTQSNAVWRNHCRAMSDVIIVGPCRT
jgi:membrane-anchored glycerophosphoryl diester phosphodiesterase (GDPDase)